MNLNLRKDDGAVVYINGIEVARSNMNFGTVGYSTLAAADNTNVTNYNTIKISPATLIAAGVGTSGQNLLAVEIHKWHTTDQASPTGDETAQLIFDAELVPYVAPFRISTTTSSLKVKKQANGDTLSQNTNPQGIADPPVFTGIEPVNNASEATGTTLLVSGNVQPSPSPVTTVTVNGNAAPVVDAGGNFFATVNVATGAQSITLSATDLAGATTSQSVNITGIDPLVKREIDFSVVQPAAAVGVVAEYGRTSFNNAKKQLYADLILRNNGTFPVGGPILVGVKNISQPRVTVANGDGVTPDGIPYYDVTDMVASGVLMPAAITSGFQLVFNNPNGVPFSYELVLFGVPNRAPDFVTAPVVQVKAGRSYQYDSDAQDLDHDTLTYTLLEGPASMSVAPTTGLINWQTTVSDKGNHSVSIKVSDGRGGFDIQRFVVTVNDAIPNRPPVWISSPVVDAYVSKLYTYPGLATDADGDTLTYSVVSGPVGLVIDASSGVVTWTPPASLVDTTVPVSLKVIDGQGGEAIQDYAIYVHPDPANRPPIIVSTPSTYFEVAGTKSPASGQVTPLQINLGLQNGQTATVPTTITLSPSGLGADVFLNFDDTGSFSEVAPQLVSQFPLIIQALQNDPALQGVSFAFGVGRFEDYANFTSGAEDRPFILNQPLITTGTPEFLQAIQNALSIGRTAPGDGGDLPESDIESLYQIATGIGFDGNGDGDNVDSGPAGPVQTQTDPGFSGDVPAFSSFIPDLPNKVLPASGTFGGVGFRGSALPIVIMATDTGTAYEPENPAVANITGVGGSSVAYSKFLARSRGTTPDGRGAKIQQTVTALNNLGALVIGLGTGTSANDDPRQFLEALATLTGAVNKSGTPIPSGIPGDDIENNEPFYFKLNDSANGSSVLVNDNVYTGNYAPNTQIVIYPLNNDDPTGAGGQLTISSVTQPSGGSVAISPNGDYLIFTPSSGTYVRSDFQYTVTGTSLSFSQSATVRMIPTKYHAGMPYAFGGGGGYGAGPGEEFDPGYGALPLAFNDDVYLKHLEPNTSIDIHVLSNDNDNDNMQSFFNVGNNALRYKISGFTQPAAGTGTVQLSTNADFFTYTPPVSPLASPTTFTYTIQDGNGSTSNATVTVNPGQYGGSYYGGGPLGPGSGEGETLGYGGGGYGVTTANNDNFYFFNNSLQPFTLHLLNNDSDPDNDRLVITSVTQPAAGSVVIGANQDRVIYTAPASGVVDTTFTYTASDGNGHTATGTVSIFAKNIVGLGGVAPIAVNDTIKLSQFVSPQTLKLFVLNNDKDANADAITITNVTQPTQGSVSIDANGDYLIYTPPVSGFTSTSFTYTINDNIDGTSTATVSLVGSGLGDLPGFAGGVVRAIKSALTSVQYDVNMIASDNSPLFQNLTGIRTNVAVGSTVGFDAKFTGDGFRHSFDLLFTKSGTNVILGSIPVSINDFYRYDVDAIDPDNDPITYSLLAGAPAGATIDPVTGMLTWTPPAAGLYPFTVQAADDRGGYDRQTYTVTVTMGQANSAPTIDSVAPTNAQAGSPFSYPVQASDPDQDPLQFFLENGTSGSVPAGMAIHGTTGLVTWSPGISVAGTFTFDVRTIDGRGGAATQTVTLSVAPWSPNTDPNFYTSPVTQAVAGRTYFYTAQATDAEHDPLRYELASGPAGMVVEPITGKVGWRPTVDDIGTHTAIIKVSDGRGGVDLQSYEIVVTDVNEAPTFTSTPIVKAATNRQWTYQLAATDPNGDVLQYRLVTAPNFMSLNAQNQLNWVPTAPGIYRVEVLVDDNRGGTDTQSFIITVTTNAPATITSLPDTRTIIGQVYSYPVVASDPNPGDTVTLSLDPESLGRGMTLVGSTVTWTPGRLGDFPVSIKAVDQFGDGVVQSYTLSVVEQVVPSEPPTFTSQPVGPAYVGQAWTYVLSATDPDSNVASLAYSLTSPALGGGVAFNAGTKTLTWTPSAVGTKTFTVRVTDPQGSYAEQTFTVNAVAVRNGSLPVIRSVPTGPAILGTEYVYAVDAYDPDGDTLTYSLVNPVPGASIDAQTGRLVYNPTATGSATIAIRVADGIDGNVTQTFTLDTVLPPNNAPRFVSTPVGPATAGVQWRYQAAATDPDNDPVSYSLNYTGSETVSMTPAGLVTWTPSAVNAQITASVTASDGRGGSATQTFTLSAGSSTNTNPSNTPPVFVSVPKVLRTQVKVGLIRPKRPMPMATPSYTRSTRVRCRAA